MLEIREVPYEFASLRKDIYRLRYDVHSANKGLGVTHHAQKSICEPLDETGHIDAVFAEDEMVASIRTNYASECELDDYLERRGIDSGEFEYLAVSSKMVVHSGFRASTMAARLHAVVYERLLEDGIRFSVIDIEPSLVSVYERLGYRVRGRIPYRYPEVGEAVVMVLDLHDAKHLRRVHSPLLKLYEAWVEEGAGAFALAV
jgi:hypothetical protein